MNRGDFILCEREIIPDFEQDGLNWVESLDPQRTWAGLWVTGVITIK